MTPPREGDPASPPDLEAGELPLQRIGGSCDLYGPGHQIHYKHQGAAVRSRSHAVVEARQRGSLVILTLEDGGERQWRHHDPERLRRILELVPGSRVAYPGFHALRVGPYWFNCARESDAWEDCRPVPPSERA